MDRRPPPVTAALLARRARALERHLPAAVSGDGIGVHQARVASRRLREVVPVLAVDLPRKQGRKTRRRIRRVTRALGVVRELDVTLTVLDAMAAANTLPRMALEEVRRHVVEEREARRAAMLERLGHLRLGKLQRRLARFARKLEAASTDRWRDALRARLVKRSKGLANAVEKAGQMYSPEALHRVRIAAKKLRYTLEMAFDAGVRPAGPLVTRLKRVQDSLGRLHDLQVLLGHVAEVQAAAPGRQLPKGSLDQVAQALERECRHLHAQYVAAVPRLLELTRVARREIAPALLTAAPLGAQQPGGAGASPSQT